MKKNIMRIVMLVLAAAMLLSCTACGGSGSSSDSKDRLAQIKEKGYIELCTEPYFAPFEYVDPIRAVTNSIRAWISRLPSTSLTKSAWS